MNYGLIGEKLGHSFSKEIHGQIADYDYELVELEKNEVEPFIKRRDFKAINVTIPYKETVMPYLDSISDNAIKIGSVNTVVNKNGKLYGYNTDYSGAEALIRHIGVEIKGKKVMILGSGGTSKTMNAVVRDMGACSIINVSRRAEQGRVTYEDAIRLHSDAQVIINTTPVGMYPKNEGCPIDIDLFPRLEGVVDAIYNPLKTKLVQKAKQKGLCSGGGLYMLSAQAVFASGLFTDKKLDDSFIDKAYSGVLREKQNIVLIGMPSCGKTSIGKKLACLLGKEFIDTDDEIVKTAGRPIPDIMAEQGEDGFRQIEHEVIDRVSRFSGKVISTGGGAVLDSENVRNLGQNGMIFFIDRSLDRLITTPDRPLTSTREALERKYRERYPVYTSSCDIKIDGDGTVDEVALLIKEGFINENIGD